MCLIKSDKNAICKIKIEKKLLSKIKHSGFIKYRSNTID